MPEDQSNHTPDQTFRDQNVIFAFNLIRQLTIHCVMFLPAPELTDATKALLHTHLVRIANLYEPGKATI